jgi:enoyl-CoA hydratase/carnithine racemase
VNDESRSRIIDVVRLQHLVTTPKAAAAASCSRARKSIYDANNNPLPLFARRSTYCNHTSNPKPFHALSLEMIHAMHDVLENWYHPGDDSSNNRTIQAILLKSNPDGLKRPAFCAGGDVKSIYMSILQENDDVRQQRHGHGRAGLMSADFFRHEYTVNHALATVQESAYTTATTAATSSTTTNTNGNNEQQQQQQQQPVQISLWNGLVMGGGVGISIHGKYRVATEHTIFSMPETAIGFFPDVGSLYWMPRLLSPGNAVYLALTGRRLHADDLLYTGLATHYVPSHRLHDLEAALIQATMTTTQSSATVSGGGSGSVGGVAPVLSLFHQAPPKDPAQSMLAREKNHIDAVFGPALQDDSCRVEHIVASLEKMKQEGGTESENAFSRETLATLGKMSPTSLQVTLEGLRRGAKCNSIGQDLVMEFRMSQHFMRQDSTTAGGPPSDFMKGIRAMLVDKGSDKKPPQWNPARLEDVTDEVIASYFGPIEHEWEIPETTSSLRLILLRGCVDGHP